jgi:hypothetical protein
MRGINRKVMEKRLDRNIEIEWSDWSDSDSSSEDETEDEEDTYGNNVQYLVQYSMILTSPER